MAVDPYFFGYGSLVNRATQAYPDAIRTTLKGWRRVWRPTVLRDVAFLSAVPTGHGEIQGLAARVPAADWAALDARETGYARHDVSDLVPHSSDVGSDVQVYAVAQEHHADDVPIRLLASYVDVVVQGYLREFGEAGVAGFFETTDGWKDALIVEDRGSPQYPRAQALSVSELALVDRWLARVGTR